MTVATDLPYLCVLSPAQSFVGGELLGAGVVAGRPLVLDLGQVSLVSLPLRLGLFLRDDLVVVDLVVYRPLVVWF